MRLLNLISGWVKWPLAGGIVLIPPGGAQGGGVRIHEQLRPLRGLRSIIDEIVDKSPEQRSTLQVGPLRRLVTAEGEHAGIVTLSAKTASGDPLERTLSMIVGDDAYALIDAAIHKSELFAPARELVQEITENYFLGLGDKRRRRYFYRPPAGWHAIGRAHAVRYYHPDYPRHPAILSVFDARPASVTPPEVTDRVLFMDFTGGLERDPPEAPEPIKTRRGLSGQLTKISGHLPGGRQVVFIQGALVDSRYAYMVHLETTEEALPHNIVTLLELLDSIEGVPSPRKTSDGSELIQWVD